MNRKKVLLVSNPGYRFARCTTKIWAYLFKDESSVGIIVWVYS